MGELEWLTGRMISIFWPWSVPREKEGGGSSELILAWICIAEVENELSREKANVVVVLVVMVVVKKTERAEVTSIETDPV